MFFYPVHADMAFTVIFWPQISVTISDLHPHPPKSHFLTFYTDTARAALLVVAFARVRGLWENVRQFIPRLRFFFFFLVEISSCALIPLFRPGSVYTGSASWDDCDRVFPDELRVSSFPDSSAHSDFVESRVYACLGVTCHLHFWQNERDLLRATAVTRGGTDTE